MSDSQVSKLSIPALAKIVITTKMKLKGWVECNGAGRRRGCEDCSHLLLSVMLALA